MPSIPLTKGQTAVVDLEDVPELLKWKWHALWSPKTKSFYAYGRPRGRYQAMHSFLLGGRADHKNHNTLDNRRENLRKCTQAENLRNQKLRADNTSGFKGVSWDSRSGRWRVMVQGKYVGNFLDKKEAARAYDEKAKLQFGEFAHLNFQ